MNTTAIRKQAMIFLGVLIVYSAVYIYFGLGGLLRFSFWEPELMINSRYTAGHVSEQMRWTHFSIWLPANLTGIYACIAASYASYLCYRGKFFSRRFAWSLTHVGIAILLTAICDILATAIVPHNLSSLNPAGQLPLRFRFLSEEMGLILCGAGFMALGQMMAEATRLSDENKSFI